MNKRLFVGNLNFAMTDTKLREIVARQTSLAPSQIRNADVARDPATGNSRGFGFVDLASIDDARRACAELDGIKIMGRSLRVEFAKSLRTTAEQE
jgi:RNA recognition motif-containing protein